MYEGIIRLLFRVVIIWKPPGSLDVYSNPNFYIRWKHTVIPQRQTHFNLKPLFPTHLALPSLRASSRSRFLPGMLNMSLTWHTYLTNLGVLRRSWRQQLGFIKSPFIKAQGETAAKVYWAIEVRQEKGGRGGGLRDGWVTQVSSVMLWCVVEFRQTVTGVLLGTLTEGITGLH